LDLRRDNMGISLNLVTWIKDDWWYRLAGHTGY